MNLPIDREFVAHTVIILAVCVGAWMLAVRPQVEEVAKMQQQMSQAAAEDSPIPPQTIEAASKRMQTLRSRLEQIEAFNRLGSDSSRVYGLVMDLADEHRVQVLSLQPAEIARAKDAQVASMRVDLTVEGEYQQVARFIEAICGIDAFIKPLALHLTPATESQPMLVAARFACQVSSFSLPEALATTEGTTHGEP